MGDITSINPQLLNTLVEGGYLPVVASVAADPSGQALNVNADIAAGEVTQSQHNMIGQKNHSRKIFKILHAGSTPEAALAPPLGRPGVCP